jgi:hypothetical protein
MYTHAVQQRPPVLQSATIFGVLTAYTFHNAHTLMQTIALYTVEVSRAANNLSPASDKDELCFLWALAKIDEGYDLLLPSPPLSLPLPSPSPYPQSQDKQACRFSTIWIIFYFLKVIEVTGFT